MIIDSKKYNGNCPCGKSHIMQTELSVIEKDCLKKADAYFKKLGINGKIVAVYDENTYKATCDRHITADCEVVLNPENLHANEHGVELLMQSLDDKADVLVAVGSGTVHDITRYCAYKTGADFVSCPTAASVDGFCSSVAAMTWNGCKKTLTAVAPRLVLADTEIIKNAPVRLAKSGFGDMIGKYVALADWRIAHIITDEFYCERIFKLMSDATKAVLECVDGIMSADESAFEKLMYGLLISGLAMQMMGNSRPASGAEHHISHMIEMLELSDNLHGEKVGVGTLVAIAEYKRLAKTTSDFCNYATFEKHQLLPVFFDKMTEELLLENKTDAADGITKHTLCKCWQKICDEIARIPDVDTLKAIYDKADIKSTLEDIGVNADKLTDILAFSPAVRNRLTLMRLKKCLK